MSINNLKTNRKMKQLLIIAICILLTSCGETSITTEEVDLQTNYKVIVIDGCEYIGYNFMHNNSMLTHKGNCKYCKQRLKTN